MKTKRLTVRDLISPRKLSKAQQDTEDTINAICRELDRYDSPTRKTTLGPVVTIRDFFKTSKQILADCKALQRELRAHETPEDRRIRLKLMRRLNRMTSEERHKHIMAVTLDPASLYRK